MTGSLLADVWAATSSCALAAMFCRGRCPEYLLFALLLNSSLLSPDIPHIVDALGLLKRVQNVIKTGCCGYQRRSKQNRRMK